MIQKINTINDVKKITNHLLNVENLSIHPDDDFKDYINFKTNQPFYSILEAEKRNKLMNDCFKVCDREQIEIYELVNQLIVNNQNM